jgi:Mce-associated membrane protein
VVKVLGRAKMITKANVLDAAVTALDLKKGTASVIASVNVTRTPVQGAASTVRNRFRASMTRTGGEWKLANLAVVPVSLS